MKRILVVGGSIVAVIILILASFPSVVSINPKESTKLFRFADEDEIYSKNLNEMQTFIFDKLSIDDWISIIDLIMYCIVWFFILLIEYLNS